MFLETTPEGKIYKGRRTILQTPRVWAGMPSFSGRPREI